MSFLSFAGYYGRFIEGFSNFAFPLTQLTRNGQAFVWSVQCDESFQELKKKLTSASVLIFPSPSESFVVYYDASKMGLGGMLMRMVRLCLMLPDSLKFMRVIMLCMIENW